MSPGEDGEGNDAPRLQQLIMRVPVEMYVALKARAKQEDRSMNAVVNRALRAHLAESDQGIEPRHE